MNRRDARLSARLPACQRCNRSDCQCRQPGCLSHLDLPASRRDFLRGAAAMSALAFVGSARGADEAPMSLPLVGYNEHRTNLPGGRHANVSTNRAMVVKADGTERHSHGAAFDRWQTCERGRNLDAVRWVVSGWQDGGCVARLGECRERSVGRRAQNDSLHAGRLADFLSRELSGVLADADGLNRVHVQPRPASDGDVSLMTTVESAALLSRALSQTV